MANISPDRPSLRLGSKAPDFEAETTQGKINFHEWLGDSWVRPFSPVLFIQLLIHLFQGILFSHPGDFTPVCTTELGEVARRQPDFAKRNTKVIGISANGLEEHNKWVKDINDFGGKSAGPTDVRFPIVRRLQFAFVEDVSLIISINVDCRCG